jgi:hypothetical protein
MLTGEWPLAFAGFLVFLMLAIILVPGGGRPFDKLRVNGIPPIMVSLPNHANSASLW